MTTPPDPQQGQPPQSPAQPPAPNNGAVSDDAQVPPAQPPYPGQPGQYPPPYQGQPQGQPQYPAQQQYPPQPYQGQPQYQGQPYPQQPQQPQYQGQPTYPGQQSFPERPPLPGEQQAQQGQQSGYPYQAAGGGSYPYPYSAHPAGLTEGANVPVSKPAAMHISLVLLIISALLPMLLGGLLVAVSFSAQTQLNNISTDLGVAASGIVGAFRVLGGVIVVLGIAYIVFAVFAYRGRNWSRIVVTVLTGIFDAALVYVAIGGATSGTSTTSSNAVGLAILGGIIVISIAGVVLMFVSKSSAFYAAAGQRR